MRNSKPLSFKVKGLLFITVVLCVFLNALSGECGKIVTKSSIPDWATQKKELYFDDIELLNVLSMMVPADVKIDADLMASEVKVKAKGLVSVEELLGKYKEKVEYQFKGNTLEIRGYVIRKYEIPYLPATYSSTQTYQSQGNYYVSSSGLSVGGTSGTSGSTSFSATEKTSVIDNKINIDFWNEIKNEIREILGAVDIVDVSQKTVQTPQPVPQQKTLDSSTFYIQQPPTATTVALVKNYPKNFVTINKASGLLVVGCPVDKARIIDEYIENVKKKILESVEIDFTLIEVKDKNNVTVGMNWETVLKNVLFKSSRTIMGENDVQIISFNPASGSFSLVGKTREQFDASGANKQNLIINALREVADVKILTKTNLLLKNNTTVGFNSGVLTSFIDSVQGSSTETSVSYTVNKGTVLSGIDLVISANIEGDNITLSVIPTISSLVALEEKKFGENMIVQNPTVESKKSVATVTLKNGETTAIVGYNVNNKTKQRQGFPILGDIPVIGLFFSKSEFVDENASIIMLLTPKIKRI